VRPPTESRRGQAYPLAGGGLDRLAVSQREPAAPHIVDCLLIGIIVAGRRNRNLRPVGMFDSHESESMDLYDDPYESVLVRVRTE